MKISSVIVILRAALEEYGDIEVMRVSDEYGDLNEPSFDYVTQKDGQKVVEI